MTELISFILTAGIIISCILILLVVKNSKQDNSRRILLGIFTLSLAVTINAYAELHKFDVLYILTLIPSDLTEWIIGPLLLLYLQAIFKEEGSSFSYKLKLFAPAILLLVFIEIPFLISALSGKQYFPYLKVLDGYELYYYLLRDLYFMIYMIISYQFFLKSKKNLANYYSSDFETSFKWIEYLLIGLLLIMMLDFSTELWGLLGSEYSDESGYLTLTGMVSLFAYLGYYGINQSSVLLPDFIWDRKPLPTPTEIAVNVEIQSKLEQILVSQKPYLNENLTLTELADLANMSDKKLSGLLNSQMNSSFYDLINDYRIEHFVTLLKSEKILSHTIFSLAQESGFKSKATFNRIFKKKYNCTPTAFLSKN